MVWTLVTGGAKGLGAEICKTLAALDYDLVIHYNTSKKGAKEIQKICQSQGVRAEIIQGSFDTIESTQRFCNEYLERFTLTHNLINNVGNFLIKPALKTTVEEWLSIFQNNLNAPFIITKALENSIKEEKGAIINIGVSGLHTARADIYSTAYTCAKMGLWMLTKSLAKEMASDFVRVNMVSPGYMENAVDLPRNSATLPMGRPGKLSEVADVIAFLLDTPYVTGQNIEVAGGLRL